MTRSAATFYSRTAFSIGSLKLTAGMYKLFPFQSQDGWRLAIARQEGDGTDALKPSQILGKVEMNTVATDRPPTDKLGVQLWFSPFPVQCPNAQSGRDVRELEFIFGSTDVSVCLRPDQVSPSRDDKVLSSATD